LPESGKGTPAARFSPEASLDTAGDTTTSKKTPFGPILGASGTVVEEKEQNARDKKKERKKRSEDQAKPFVLKNVKKYLFHMGVSHFKVFRTPPNSDFFTGSHPDEIPR
jgi:hypothetical protein